MKKFEYKYNTIYSDLDNELSKLGEEGWEIFSIEERDDNSYKYFAKREKIKENELDNHFEDIEEPWMILDSFGQESWMDSNEVYVNIGTCVGDEWINSLWKRVLVKNINSEGILVDSYPNRRFKEYIPKKSFRPNDLIFSLEHLHRIKKI